ncbi:MAG TPA: nuclear transport factor 2 family protein [Candidatus Limnocylindria bacterium]|nr:nuclear transport factor 2 family protein [Candidatus Limnocylindria bacterium]
MTEQGTATLKRTSDASVELVRRAVEAFNTGDAQTATAMLADDIEWHEIGRADAIIGKDALAARFAGALPEWEITAETHDILANDDHAIALVTAIARMGGRSLTYRTVEIFHIRDGKISARWAFSDDTAAINRFFAGS